MFIYGSCSSVEPWRAREQSEEPTLLVVVDHTHWTADLDKWDYVYIVLSTVLGYLLVPGTLTLTLTLKLPYILTLSLNPKLALSLTLSLILSLTQHPNTNPKLDLFLNLGPRH